LSLADDGPVTKLIRDRYEPIETVGAGGQGHVLLALDRLHDRRVAIKIRPAGDAAERQALLGEARILLSLRPHPLLPLVREDFFDSDRYCLVMDWVEGRTLQDVLAERGSPGLPLDEVLVWLGDVAEALDHLHGSDPPVVHRDVKPANIVLASNGRAVLVDLGIAATSGSADAGGHSRGYTAPEIASGVAASPPADVFGLAATAFALLTGAPPRAGTRPRWKGMRKERARLVEAALRRGLALDPARRPATASELIASMRAETMPPGNLPLQLTTFVGRETETADVARLVRAARLVTLTGPGGIGKTRLALAAASDELARFPDGVWFVDLAALTDADLVPRSVASVVGVKEEPGEDLADALTGHLATRTALIVLDNCEHLVAACAAVVQTVLRAAPNVSVLATSREPLGVGGETTWRVPPLTVPGERDAGAGSSDSVRLFVDRARLVNPSFAPDESAVNDVVDVCRRLDGIPLAIELAAARTNVLSPAEISARLSDRFRLLAAGKGAAPDRQRSLRAVVDWSYDLLADAERVLLRRLAIFAGGCTLDAAERVCNGEGQILDVLSQLVDKSLVTIDDTTTPTRYGMLETIRSYAHERLTDAREFDELTARHRAWCIGLVEEIESVLDGPGQAAAMDTLEVEHDNIRAALGSVAAAPGDGARIAAAMWRFWDVRGYLTEGRTWLQRSLTAPEALPLPLRARTFRAAGGIALTLGEYETARAHCEQALALARDAGDRTLMASALNALAIAAGAQSDFAREWTLYEESLTLWRELGNKRGIAVTLGNLGTTAYEQGDVERARPLLLESLALRRELGDRQGLASSLNSLALVAGARGDHDEENALYEECLALWRELGYKRGVAIATLNMGTAAEARGDVAAARPLLEESVDALRELGVQWDLAEALLSLGMLEHQTGDGERAVSLVREALQIRAGLGDKRGLAECLESLGMISGGDHAVRALAAAASLREALGAEAAPERRAAIDRTLTTARSELGNEAFAAAWKTGRALSVEDAVSLALGENEGAGPATGTGSPR
jgi:non-specific serine/threonine protein kinase